MPPGNFPIWSYVMPLYVTFVVQSNVHTLNRECSLQLLYIIVHEMILSNSVSEYTYGLWKVSGAWHGKVTWSWENKFKHTKLHHCSYISQLNLQHTLCLLINIAWCGKTSYVLIQLYKEFKQFWSEDKIFVDSPAAGDNFRRPPFL